MNYSAYMREITNNSFHNTSLPNSKLSVDQKYARANIVNRETKTPGSAGRKKLSKSINLTPSRNPNYDVTTNHTPGGDRYIATRHSEQQMEIARYLLSNSTNESLSQGDNASSPQKAEYQRIMSENLNGGVTSEHPADSANHRILRFTKERGLAPRGFTNAAAALYTVKPALVTSHKKSMRHIPTSADRILDAPFIVDDYYLNVLDWSSSNILAVALGGQLFLWNAASGTIDELLDLKSETEYVSSVAWNKDDPYLAVGVSDSTVEIWDTVAKKRCRVLNGHRARVGALSWNTITVSSGDKTGLIRNNDVRVPNSLISTLNNHTQEVCGLKWSPNNRYLASGGNDNLLNIWQLGGGSAASSHDEAAPLHTFGDHMASVKALAWCPWQHNVLASGGGMVDRQIKLWNCNSGSCLSSTDAQSQVSSLLWSHHYRELLSSHGYPNYQLAIWKYPQMMKVVDWAAHTGRILHTAMSPCGEYVVSAAADETLRIWHCFQIDAEEKKRISEMSSVSMSRKVQSTAGKIMSTMR